MECHLINKVFCILFKSRFRSKFDKLIDDSYQIKLFQGEFVVPKPENQWALTTKGGLAHTSSNHPLLAHSTFHSFQLHF